MKFFFEQVFNRLEWDDSLKGQLDDIRLSYIHRGAPNDRVVIPYNKIKDIDGHYFIIDTEYEEDTYIPFHRVLRVWNEKTGHLFYLKAKK